MLIVIQQPKANRVDPGRGSIQLVHYILINALCDRVGKIKKDGVESLGFTS